MGSPAERPRAGLTLVLGGVRSGKSAWAEAIAAAAGPRVAYIATGKAGDAEMRRRIQAHRARRPPGWTTVEEPCDAAGALRRCLADSPDAVLIDGAGMLALHWLWPDGDAGAPPEAAAEPLAAGAGGPPPWRARLDALVDAAAAAAVPVIVVSDEVGHGIAPPDPAARLYADVLGAINQALAAAARDVYLVVAGLPLRLKGEGGPVG